MQFEYELLILHNEGDNDHRNFCWKSNCHGHLGNEECLIEVLNERGKEGWHVVSSTSDSHFGNKIILQRTISIEDEAIKIQEPIQPIYVMPMSEKQDIKADLAIEFGQLRNDYIQIVALQNETSLSLIKEVSKTFEDAIQPICNFLKEEKKIPAVEIQQTFDPSILQNLENKLVASIENLQQAIISVMTKPEPIPEIFVQPEVLLETLPIATKKSRILNLWPRRSISSA